MDNPAQPNLPVMEMIDLAVSSRDNPADPILENINWTVKAGEYWVLGGMHGSGKTELLSLADGLAAPLRGAFRLFGREMPVRGDEFLAERLRIGLVFEDGQLFHHLSIEENIALPLRYHRELAHGHLEDSVKRVLEWCGLLPQAARLPGRMERAWRKRAGLARALALEPEVLLLDNPLGGLDPRHAQWWFEALNQLSAGHGYSEGRPLTLVVTAEDLRPWRNRPATFALLHQNQFRLLGPHPALGDLPDPFVKELLSEPPPAQ
ncbi:MAG: ATP-binding cassette domain-containing protein [Limisphaerales bacterium]